MSKCQSWFDILILYNPWWYQNLKISKLIWYFDTPQSMIISKSQNFKVDLIFWYSAIPHLGGKAIFSIWSSCSVK